jgi:hypothetical protein
MALGVLNTPSNAYDVTGRLFPKMLAGVRDLQTPANVSIVGVRVTARPPVAVRPITSGAIIIGAVSGPAPPTTAYEAATAKAGTTEAVEATTPMEASTEAPVATSAAAVATSAAAVATATCQGIGRNCRCAEKTSCGQYDSKLA